MKLILAFVLAATACFAAADEASVAAALAKEAQTAENSGQLVRAYLLYSAAAVKDPRRPSYAVHREALAPRARLLMQAGAESADVSADIKEAEARPQPAAPPPTVEANIFSEISPTESLQPPPHLQPNGSTHDFDLRLDEKTAIAQVAREYGIETVFDPGFEARPVGHFQIDHADFLTAMDAITQVTNTFVYPVSPRRIFVARDTEPKRDEFEPVVVLTIPVPDSIEPAQVIEAATAVRGALSLKAIGWDSVGHNLVVRDRITKARVAAALLADVVLPKPQIAVEIQIVALDSDVAYHYGTALPTSFPGYAVAHLGGINNFPDLTNVSALLILGSRTNFFGLAIGNATLFATYSKSASRVLYDATVAVSDGKTASFHVGEKYPIPTSLYSGAQQSSSSGAIYNPIGQVTQEDLGIVLKVGARTHGDGDISLDIEAAYKTLGTTTIDTVPAINQREFKGSIRLRPDEYAIIAGMESDQRTNTRDGLAGIASLPGINQVLAENTRDHTTSDTLILVKPAVTQMPVSDTISPQYLLGPLRGTRVLM